MDHVMNDCRAEPAVALAAPRAIRTAVPRLPDEAASLSALWTELVNGFCKVEETRFTSQTCTLVVSRRPPAVSAAALTKRDIEILEQSLLDGVRKSVAVDFELCASSMAEVLRRGFAFMGLACWPSRIPLVLVMAAHAKHAEASISGGKLSVALQRPVRQSVIATRPDLNLSSELPRAELAVTRLLIEGKSYAEIAELRQTSKRTVANQLASAFHRLGVSGRAELLCLLAKRQVLHWQAEPAPSSSVRPFTHAPAGSAPGLARVAGERR